TFVLAELGSELGGVVSRTDRISGGLLILPGEGVALSAVAAGAFPRGGVEFALSTNAGFERERAQIAGRDVSYFRQADGLLQVALPRDDYLFVSSGRILEMLRDRPPAELSIDPGVYRALRRVGTPYGPAATVIFDDPGAGLLGSLGVQAPALPLTRIDLSLSVAAPPVPGEVPGEADPPATRGLELGGALHLRTERDAALFGRIGRVFVLLFVRALGLESESVQAQAVIEVEGASVVFSGIRMTRDELVNAVRNLAGGDQ
ncbi:MAG: hypothetical protein ACOC1U_09490, partial [Spirochaetota bacterium]